MTIAIHKQDMSKRGAYAPVSLVCLWQERMV